jgi:hydroxymethylpyrimidine pyrophosphatase-like HAD family hydrolase
VYQILGFFEAGQEARVMQHLPHCVTTRWSPLFTDIVPAGSNKWAGITNILAHFGILPDETMAFGDGGNDMEMLTNAGIGVAMGNADENVKQAADYITATVDGDGIVKALRHFNLTNIRKNP